jgi:hypothetical protein
VTSSTSTGVDLSDEVHHPVDVGCHRRGLGVGVGLFGDGRSIVVDGGDDVGEHAARVPRCDVEGLPGLGVGGERPGDDVDGVAFAASGEGDVEVNAVRRRR